MVIRIRHGMTYCLAGILILLGLFFFCYGVFSMDGSERLELRETNGSAKDVPEHTPMVALTYDDGPYAPVTERILDSLNAVGGKATFFVVGSRVAGREETLHKIQESGCEIGNHTYDHVVLTNITHENAIAQLQKTDEAIEKVIGEKPKLIRPPCGCITKQIEKDMDRPLVLWTIDTRDWSHQNANETVKIVLHSVKDGDIILMHDLFPSTAEASEILIPALVNQGFRLVTVSELLKEKEKN